ncbi:TIGR04255 family protein [Candidatus Poribacteria bacterium]|nr:TIGR04255 family protein [Candidatus Poribacteria bacterium]
MLTAPLPEYGRPPVVEVVCGIAFEPLDGLLVPYLGLLWETFRSDYPICRELPPIAKIVERFGGEPSGPEMPDIRSPLVRFLTSDEQRVVQVQRDRFLCNWKKVDDAQAYPRYPAVIDCFRRNLDGFEHFLACNGLGALSAIQYELTYVNHIPQGEGWTGTEDIDAVFPALHSAELVARSSSHLEAVNCGFSFTLPDIDSRLRVTLANARRRNDNVDILSLDLLVRGLPKDTSREAMWRWFDTAHHAIVKVFSELTSEDVQNEVWYRKGSVRAQ